MCFNKGTEIVNKCSLKDEQFKMLVLSALGGKAWSEEKKKKTHFHQQKA